MILAALAPLPLVEPISARLDELIEKVYRSSTPRRARGCTCYRGVLKCKPNA